MKLDLHTWAYQYAHEAGAHVTTDDVIITNNVITTDNVIKVQPKM